VEDQDKQWIVSYDEQKRQGLIRKPEYRETFVSSGRNTNIQTFPQHQITVDVDHPAKQEIILHTSAVDRAKGYQLIITPLAIGLGILAVLATIMLWDVPVLSFKILVIFWVSFVITWLVGWIITMLGTPEFVSWYGAKRQWDIIEREQRERWEYYWWQNGGSQNDFDQPRPWYIEYKTLIYMTIFMWTIGVVLLVIWG